jgi:hypothetical protein
VLQDSAYATKDGLEKTAVSQPHNAVDPLIMAFASILVPEENILILIRFVDQHVLKDTIKTDKTVQNVICHVLNVMALKLIIVWLANT